MTAEQVRRFCMSLPHTTEQVQWGNDLVFKVGGKMYAIVVLEPSKVFLSFASTPEEFAELCERAGVIPAPYCARYHWVALEHEDAIPATELKPLLKKAYTIVLGKLTKRARAALA